LSSARHSLASWSVDSIAVRYGRPCRYARCGSTNDRRPLVDEWTTRANLSLSCAWDGATLSLSTFVERGNARRRPPANVCHAVEGAP
jgi:hypothetical protein